MRDMDLLLFALDASRAHGEQIARALGAALQPHEERDFGDGEHKARPLVSVRGRDVYVLQSLHGGPGLSANDKLCRLLFFIGALKDADAKAVTALVPYLCYARKDRKTQTRDPVTMRYVAALFEAAGTDRVVTAEVHNLAAFQNAFRCRTEHLVCDRLIANHLVGLIGDAEVAMVSPDAGGVKRAERLRAALARHLGRPVAGAFVEKYRAQGVVSGGNLVGDVAGRTAVIFDDLIASGETLMRAARACRTHGARRVVAAAAHGLFTGGAEPLLREPAIDSIVVTDTVPPFRLRRPGVIGSRVTVLETSPFLAEAIRRLHAGDSLVELMAP